MNQLETPFKLKPNLAEQQFGSFTSKEIRLFTNAQPEAISKAEFFRDDYSDDEQFKRFIGYRDPKLPADLAPQGRRAAAGGNSLVQRCKSPTKEELAAQRAQKETHTRLQKLVQWGDLFKRQAHIQRGHIAHMAQPEPLMFTPIDLDWEKNPVKCLQAHGFVENAPAMARLMHREWSNEWRIRIQAQGRPSEAPPAQGGDRFTDKLTDNAVRKVFESGAYVQVLRGGYSTFCTLTFSDEQREKVLTSKPQSKNRTKPGKAGSIVVMSPHGSDQYRVSAFGAFSWLDDMGQEGELAAINMTNAKPLGETPEGQTLFEVLNPSVRADGPWTKIRDYCPDSTIGAEVSRFVDLSQKMYQRGWIPDFMPQRVKRGQSRVKEAGEKCGRVIADGPFTPIRRGDSKDKIKQNPRWKINRNDELKKTAVPLDYCWVAEMPANEDGEPNPHVHLIMRWKVPKTHFHAWAGRLERLWGNGFAKLEKIKHAKAGAGYLVKAVGYAAKGRDGNQGLIRGNRYGISAIARAKGWKNVANFLSDNMAAIIAECEEKLARKKAHYIETEKRASYKLKEAKRLHQITKHSKKLTPEAKKAKIDKFTARMLELDEEIDQARVSKRCSGVIATGHYQITFSGDKANENFDRFMGWAFNNRGWQANSRNESMKEHLRQEKNELVKQLREEHKNLQDDLDLSDEQIDRLEYVHNKLKKVQEDIDYNRMLRLQMATALKNNRSYWRHFNDTLPERRNSLDYWSSFLNRYERDEEEIDRDQLLTLMHQEDMLCKTKTKGSKPTGRTVTTQSVH
ncbi:rolling circle replication-associated protein [Photobacterium sanguinicancri]|uniref:rolling circle replication-associated protein n=1 Tax=Photobacterium sanguinicancri TaxID=875932 RepID=UPI002480F7B7|nr:hypothetical protein [Photobacterium sanguinicancri]